MPKEALTEIDLSNVAKGAAPELFNRELAKLVANVLDPNTDAKAPQLEDLDEAPPILA